MRCLSLPTLLFVIIGGYLMIHGEAISSHTIRSSVSTHRYSSSSGGPPPTLAAAAAGAGNAKAAVKACAIAMDSYSKKFHRGSAQKTCTTLEGCVTRDTSIFKGDTIVRGECRPLLWIAKNKEKEGLEDHITSTGEVVAVPVRQGTGGAAAAPAKRAAKRQGSSTRGDEPPAKKQKTA